MNKHVLNITVNFFSVLFLFSLLAAPFYFARNFSQVAGLKSEAPYLIVSQIEKFPNMNFSQTGDKYEISLVSQSPSQAYLGVLVINNPSNEARTYSLQASSGAITVFFGEDLNNLIGQINVPPGTSVPVSLLSQSDLPSTQTTEFSIQVN